MCLRAYIHSQTLYFTFVFVFILKTETNHIPMKYGESFQKRQEARGKANVGISRTERNKAGLT